jgi:hypothetical protein
MGVPASIVRLLILCCLAAAPAASLRAEGNRDAQGRLLVDLEIVFAGDASGSIDETEWRLQRDGHADAITNPRVLDAITSGRHKRIAAAYIEWGAPFAVGMVSGWHLIEDRASAEAFAQTLRNTPRRSFGYNSISLGIRFASGQIANNRFEGERKIIDVIGDGPQMNGPDLDEVRSAAVQLGITINAIAVNTEFGEMHGPLHMSLRDHFQYEVIAGPGAFVMEVGDDARFEDVLLNKIVREVAGLRTMPE